METLKSILKKLYIFLKNIWTLSGGEGLAYYLSPLSIIMSGWWIYQCYDIIKISLIDITDNISNTLNTILGLIVQVLLIFVIVIFCCRFYPFLRDRIFMPTSEYLGMKNSQGNELRANPTISYEYYLRKGNLYETKHRDTGEGSFHFFMIFWLLVRAFIKCTIWLFSFIIGPIYFGILIYINNIDFDLSEI